MIIEHECVTTAPCNDALVAASAFLSSGGFASEQRAFSVGDTEWTTLDMKRGKKAARAKSVAELPQRILIQFDRGRLTIAASITASPAWGGGGGYSSWTQNESPKRMALHRELLSAIAMGIDRHVAQGRSLEEARAEWLSVEAKIAAAAKKRRTRLLITAVCVVALIAGLIAFAFYMGSR